MTHIQPLIPSFSYTVLWTRNTLGFGVKEVYDPNLTLPLNGEYYFWPREDGWKLLKEDLDSKPFFSSDAKIEILFQFTQLIQFWISYPHGKTQITQAQLDRKFRPVSMQLVAFF